MKEPLLCSNFFIEAACVHLNNYVQNKRKTVCQTDKKRHTIIKHIPHTKKYVSYKTDL